MNLENENLSQNKKLNSNKNPISTVMEKAEGYLEDINEDHEEGETTKAIEQQTSKIPSGAFLALAVGSMAISAVLAFTSKRKELANFVGLWAPSFLLLGIYNKIVKTHGSDAESAMGEY